MRFYSAEQALKFAFETMNRPIVKVASINAMWGSDGRPVDELTAHDRHAQAAMILSLCERVLPDLHMAYVRVQFGREPSGFEMLGRYLAGQYGTGLHSRRGIEQVIRSYCGDKGGIREIKKLMQCGQLKAFFYRNRGFDALDAIHAQAMDYVWSEMQEGGRVYEFSI